MKRRKRSMTRIRKRKRRKKKTKRKKKKKKRKRKKTRKRTQMEKRTRTKQRRRIKKRKMIRKRMKIQKRRQKMTTRTTSMNSSMIVPTLLRSEPPFQYSISISLCINDFQFFSFKCFFKPLMFVTIIRMD